MLLNILIELIELFEDKKENIVSAFTIDCMKKMK